MTAFDARRLASEAALDGLYLTAGPSFRWLTGEQAQTLVHIEEMVLVTEPGCETLNAFTRETQVL